VLGAGFEPALKTFVEKKEEKEKEFARESNKLPTPRCDADVTIYEW
jgi:hypothetical protein